MKDDVRSIEFGQTVDESVCGCFKKREMGERGL